MENQDIERSRKKRKKRDELLSDDESEIDSEVEEEQIKAVSIKKPRTTEILPGAVPPISVTSYMNPMFIGPPVEPMTTESITSRAASQLPPPLESPVQFRTDSIPTEIKSEETASSLIQA